MESSLDWLSALTSSLADELRRKPSPPFLVDQEFTRSDVDRFLEQIIVEDTRTLVLIGKSGAGKTNLLNHLCRAPIFVSVQSAHSITKDVQKAVIRSKISPTREVKFEIFDTPGLFDTTLRNEEITKTMNKFFLYDCSQVNLVFIMIKQDRLTGEFQKLITEALNMFQKSAVSILRLVITHSFIKSRTQYLSTFFTNPFVVKLIEDWQFELKNFVFVDLAAQDSDYRGSGQTKEDVALMCQTLMDSAHPLHKTEVFS